MTRLSLAQWLVSASFLPVMGEGVMRAGWVIGAALAIGAAAPVVAAGDNAMKVCGARYQAAKAGKTLPAGQRWTAFLAACRGSIAKPAAAQPSTAGQAAMRTRQQACAKQWGADKAAGKTVGQTWPKYWSACSARLKG
jgi:hypothetical protein